MMTTPLTQMITKRMKPLANLLSSVLVAVTVAGCASAPSRFYKINPTAKPDGSTAMSCAVAVGPVFMPASVERPQFTVTTGPNRVEFDEFNRWAAPLGDSIARVVAADLGVLLGTSRAVSAPMPDFGPAYRVTIRVERFESVRGDAKQNGEVSLEAVWTIRGPAGRDAASGQTSAREPAEGNSFDALAAAHSRALAKLSGEIAKAIRSAASEKR